MSNLIAQQSKSQTTTKIPAPSDKYLVPGEQNLSNQMLET